jgi:drug/metabolite transporter (DMT)-like permease
VFPVFDDCRNVHKRLVAIRGGARAQDTAVAAESSSAFTTSSDKENLEGIYLMALSSLSFSVMFLGVKLFSNAPTFTLIFYRSVVQAVLSGGALLWSRKKEEKAKYTATDNRNLQLLLVLRAAFGSVAVAAFFYAVQRLPLPDAITLQFTTPVFAASLAVPLLQERWRASDRLGALVCLTGVLMIARPSWLFGSPARVVACPSDATAATLVGLLGALSAGLAYVLVRKIGSRADANTMVFYYAMFSTVTAPVGSRWLGGGDSWDVMTLPAMTSTHSSSHQLLVCLGLGLFGFLGQLFTNQGLQKCESAAVATLITDTQIVFAFLFEVTILKEGLSPWSLAGTALIVGYMAYVGVGMMKKERIQETQKL